MLTDIVAESLGKDRGHSGGAFASEHLREIEKLLPRAAEASAETGCGFSTIVFSNLSKHHISFSLDDRFAGKNSSVLFAQDNRYFKHENVKWVFGPTQETLPIYRDHQIYDFILIDGPHGYPFPELEYVFLFPHLRKGGILLIDDVNIPTIGRMADILCEDEMFDPIALIGGTLALRRTDADGFDTRGDGWWLQRFNRRRVSPKRDIYLKSPSVIDAISNLKRDMWLHDPSKFPQPAVINLSPVQEQPQLPEASLIGSSGGGAVQGSDIAERREVEGSSSGYPGITDNAQISQNVMVMIKGSPPSPSESAVIAARGFIKIAIQRALGLLGYGLHRTKSIEELHYRLQTQDACIASLQRALRVARNAAEAGTRSRMS